MKYPPSPPAIGEPETIGLRTSLYFIMIAISLSSCVLAIGLGRRLCERLGTWDGVLLAIAAFILLIAVAQYLLPDVNEVPDRFSAVVLWRFRIASLGLQAVLWASLGIVFGILAETGLRSRLSQSPPNRPAFR
jgi:hypothetical protein